MINAPTYQSEIYGAAPRSSSSHVTLQPGPNPSKAQENTTSFQGRAHGNSPQSSSSHAALQPGHNSRKPRESPPSSQSHSRRVSPKSSSSHAALQPGTNPKKSRVNASSAQSHANGTPPKSSSSHAGLQSDSNPRKSRVNSGSSKNRTHGAFQSHAHGAPHNHTNGGSHSHPHEASQSHEYGGSSWTYTQGSHQQHQPRYAASQLDSHSMQLGNQHANYESLHMPRRAQFPARRDFHSDPQNYTRHPQNQFAGLIIANPSPGQSGPFLYHHLAPNHRVIPWTPTLYDRVTVPNPVKTVSDDARVLEMQEAASRGILDDSTNLGVSLRQPSANVLDRLPDRELPSSALPSSSSHVSCEQPANYLLDRDPAVISIGPKPDRALNQNDHQPSDVHQRPQDEKGGFLASLIQKHQPIVQQPSTSAISEITESDSLARSYDANAHQTYQKCDNVKSSPEAREPPTHGTQSTSKERSGQEQEPVIQNMASNVQSQATTRSNSLHGNIKLSNTSSSPVQGNSYRNRPDTRHSIENETIWIGGLYPEISEAKIREIFESYGEIRKISRVFTRKCETLRAFAFVTYVKL